MNMFAIPVRLSSCLRRAGLFAALAASVAAPAQNSFGQDPRPTEATPARSGPGSQVRIAPSSPGIVFLTVTPDLISTIRVAPGVITRVSLPEEAKSSFCGDFFDPTTNVGSFVIEKNGADVFVKPLAKSGQSNLFVKTEKTTFNFDLLIVPPAEAYRVVNVNVPQWEDQMKERSRREIAEARRNLQTEMDAQLAQRRRELEDASAAELEADRRRARTDIEVKAGEIAVTRLADGIMQGLNGVPLLERKGRFEQVLVDLDAVAYTFEGKLFVRYKLTNGNAEDLKYSTRVTIQGTNRDRKRAIDADVRTSRGDFLVPAGEAGQGVLIFERPTLERGDRLVLVISTDGRESGTEQFAQFRLLEQAQ